MNTAVIGLLLVWFMNVIQQGCKEVWDWYILVIEKNIFWSAHRDFELLEIWTPKKKSKVSCQT